MAKIDINKTELVWPGKYDDDGMLKEVPRVSLPFQIIERINESRATREANKLAHPSLFETYNGSEGNTFDSGWKNKLIWGDNHLVMSSLLDKFGGAFELIYIDPPFATGADFSVSTIIGEEELDITKEQSLIEEKVYRDTWGNGDDSYIKMMYDRLVLMKELLSDKGSLFVHCDWHVGHYLKVLLDNIFGRRSLINEIAWCYTGPGSPGMSQFNRKHDTIFWVSKGDWIFNSEDVRIPHHEKTKENFRRGLQGSGFTVEDYELAAKGKIPEDWWEMAVASRYPVDGVFRTGYATEKPWPLIERIVKTASSKGGLVGDFFCGSGTTLAVAESLQRRWIGCDLGRFAIHITRKRMLGLKDCKPFELLNLGMYERRYWQGINFAENGRTITERTLYEYLAFILRLYNAQPVTGMLHIHGKKGKAL